MTRASPPAEPSRTCDARSPTERSRSSTREPGSTPRGGSPATRTGRSASPTRAAWAWSTPSSGRTSSAIAPTDHGTSFRLAEYLIPKGLKVGLVVDDSSYGQEGAKALGKSFAHNPEAVAINLTVPTGPADLAPADPPRPARRRHRAPRLGPADDDRRRARGGSQLGLERPGLHAGLRRGPARAPAARAPPRLGRRADVRSGPADGRGRARARSSRSSAHTSSASAPSSSA